MRVWSWSALATNRLDWCFGLGTCVGAFWTGRRCNVVEELQKKSRSLWRDGVMLIEFGRRLWCWVGNKL